MLQRPLVIILIAAVAVIVAVALHIWLKRRKLRKQFWEIYQLKQRDEALNEALRNPQMDMPPADTKGPIEITWDDKAVRNRGAGAGLMIELVELYTYSRRKYVFRADCPVTIGSAKDNQLELCRAGVAQQHCEICMNGKQLCVRSLAGAKTVLIRGKESVLVGMDGVYLNSGDRIQLGEAEIQFRLLKA